MSATTGLGEHLTRHKGRYIWQPWQTQRLAVSGVGIYQPCDLGHHWLRQDAYGKLRLSDQPYAWPSEQEALAAAARYEAQNTAN